MRNKNANPGRPQSVGKPFFKAALQSDGTLELLVYEMIGQNWWSDGGVTAKTVKQAMDDAGNYSRILVRINSPGGDASEGIAIYNLLRSTKRPIEVCVDGIAASSASIVAMAGDKIIMGPNAMMMVHNAWADGEGYASDHRQLADVLDKVSLAIGKTYAVRTGKSEDEIADMMDAETWMTSQDCLDQGFCTDITEEPDLAIESEALALARQFKVLRRMKHVPAALEPGTASRNDDLNKADSCECDCTECEAGNCSACSNEDCVSADCIDCPMQAEANARVDLTGWHDKLGLPAPVSIEEARAKLEEIDARAAGAVTLDDAREFLDAVEAVHRTPDHEVVDPVLSRRYASALGR